MIGLTPEQEHMAMMQDSPSYRVDAAVFYQRMRDLEPQATPPEALTPEDMWTRFVEHLAKVDPIGDRENPEVPHKSFLGSVEKYRKIFLEATRSPLVTPTACHLCQDRQQCAVNKHCAYAPCKSPFPSASS